MYTFESRIRYSEVDRDGRLTLSGVANYFQDCSTFQSEDAGVGIAFLARERRAWVLNSWQIIVSRLPALGERVTIGTWAAAANGIYADRNYLLRGEDGEDCAFANSIWIYLDTEKGFPCRITEPILAPYPIEPRYPMDVAPRKVALPSGMEERERVPVTPLFIDTNQHVNNSQYIRIAESCLPKGLRVRQLRVEYRSSAHLGDTIVAKVAEDPTRFLVSLGSPEGKVFAALEFSKGGNHD